MNYLDDLYMQQDITESGGGGQYDTTVAATNNTPIGLAGPKGKPPQYRGRIRKGGSKAQKTGKPSLPKGPISLTVDPEYTPATSG